MIKTRSVDEQVAAEKAKEEAILKPTKWDKFYKGYSKTMSFCTGLGVTTASVTIGSNIFLKNFDEFWPKDQDPKMRSIAKGIGLCGITIASSMLGLAATDKVDEMFDREYHFYKREAVKNIARSKPTTIVIPVNTKKK